MSHWQHAEVVPLLPALPAVGEGLAALFPLLLWGLALALLIIWRHTVGALLEHLANLLDRVSVPTPFGHVRPVGFVAAGLRAADFAVQQALSVSAHATERAAVYLFHKSLATFEAVGRELYRLAEDTGRALQHVILHTIPHAIRVGIHGLEHQVGQTLHTLHLVEHALLRPLIALVHREAAAWRAGVHIIERSIAHVLPRVGHVERDLSGIRARLKTVEGKLAAATFAAAVWTALVTLGLKWLRCKNVGRAGSSICGMNPALLESLLADALLVGGALSIVELAQEMQGVVGESAGLIQRFWRAS